MGADRSEAFGLLFFTANRLEVLIDRLLAEDGLTARQWMLMAVVSRSSGKTVSIGTAASMLSTSHQNIKQMAVLLSRKGFLNMERPPEDARKLCLSMTEKSETYWREREGRDQELLNALFVGFSPEDLKDFSGWMGRLYSRIVDMERVRLAVLSDKTSEV